MNGTEFLQTLATGSNDYIEIREISKAGEVKQHYYRPDEVSNYQPPMDTNVFFGLYGRSRRQGTTDSCTTTRTLWADFDHMGRADAVQRIQASGIPYPTMIIGSGNGVHAYWILDKRSGDEALPAIKAIATATGADTRATDKARIFRLPGTYNVKAEPKLCEVLEHRGQSYTLDDFPKATSALTEASQGHTECHNGRFTIDRPCVAAMMRGVPEGQRNFALGRITKYLQSKGLTKKEAWVEVCSWNQKNRPPENPVNLRKSFNAYWVGDYKLLGCAIANRSIQLALSEYCDRPKCSVQAAIGRLELRQAVKFNNRMFNYIREISGYEFIIYGLLLKYPEGLDGEQLAGFKGNCMTNTRMIQALERLQTRGLVTIDGRIRGQGTKRRYFIKAKAQGTFGMGYTVVTNGAIMGAVARHITPAEFKLYVLLLKFAFGKSDCYPSEMTLAKELGMAQCTISRRLKSLDKQGYIRRHYKGYSLICELLI